MGIVNKLDAKIYSETLSETAQKRHKRQHPLPRAINGKQGNYVIHVIHLLFAHDLCRNEITLIRYQIMDSYS